MTNELDFNLISSKHIMAGEEFILDIVKSAGSLNLEALKFRAIERIEIIAGRMAREGKLKVDLYGMIHV